MAKQKTIDVSLTVTEAQHVREAIRLANQMHEEDLGRSNPALTRAMNKIDKATSASDTEVQNTAVDPEAAGDA